VTAGMSERGTFSLSIPNRSSSGMGSCRSSFTGATRSMYGDGRSSSNSSETSSARHDGAKGRNDSRYL